ncbi:uncharacterized protein LOC143020416 [Oratosquilla oratoria]|uniref:uncharacterized protein LOC143020416 n=1 Tax=Oratosquilla oratoria TaxID=337810 RepID=UPI003F760F6C
MAKEGVLIFVPHDILKSKELVSYSVRNNISTTQLNTIVYSFVSACGRDTSKLNLSARTTHRYRASIMSELSLKNKDDWHPSDKVLVHWDGKLMDTLDSISTDDHLPILVSGDNSTKLVGVPPLPHSNQKGDPHKGDVISTATKQLLMDWKCEENVVEMLFDTTPSNTAQKAGACVSLKKELGRALFWFACQRHVGEVILSACWDCLKMEGSSGPTIMLFKRECSVAGVALGRKYASDVRI